MQKRTQKQTGQGILPSWKREEAWKAQEKETLGGERIRRILTHAGVAARLFGRGQESYGETSETTYEYTSPTDPHLQVSIGMRADKKSIERYIRVRYYSRSVLQFTDNTTDDEERELYLPGRWEQVLWADYATAMRERGTPVQELPERDGERLRIRELLRKAGIVSRVLGEHTQHYEAGLIRSIGHYQNGELSIISEIVTRTKPAEPPHETRGHIAISRAPSILFSAEINPDGSPTIYHEKGGWESKVEDLYELSLARISTRSSPSSSRLNSSAS